MNKDRRAAHAQDLDTLPKTVYTKDIQEESTMSAIKNLLHDWEESQQQLDQSLYQAQAAMAFMANLCWSNEDCDPFHAPDQEWISETRTQLAELTAWLQEMQAARTIFDEDAV